MCGRYVLTADAEALQQEFDLQGLANVRIEARYNIAPTQTVPVISNAAPQTLTPMRWGLVPPWSKDLSMAHKMINARAETVDEKRSFKGPFAQRRCLVPANGFYEWQSVDKHKVPQFIHLQGRALFAFAGLWETWHGDGQPLHTFTILTTEPSAFVRPYHHRMAVMLRGKDAYQTWLNPDSDPLALKALLQPYTGDDLQVYAVSTQVNSPRNDTPDLIEPYQPPAQGTLF